MTGPPEEWVYAEDLKDYTEMLHRWGGRIPPADEWADDVRSYKDMQRNAAAGAC